MHSLPVEPAVIELNHCPLCIFLTPKLDINIAHEVIPQVVAHIHLFNLPVLLLQFGEHFLEEVIIVFLHLHVAHVTVRSVCGLGGVLWIPIQVEQHYGLAESRLVVKPGAPVPVPAGPDLKVKRAVNPERGAKTEVNRGPGSWTPQKHRSMPPSHQAHPVELPEGACARRCLTKKTTISRETWGISRKSPWLKVAKGPRPEEVKTPLGRGCL